MPRQKSDHVDSAQALAARLREARERAGLSQRRLARGVCTPAYISRLEKGERIPSLQLLRQLAERLDVDADALASGVSSRGDALLDAELALRLDELEHAEELFRAASESHEPRTQTRARAGLGQIAFRRGDHLEAIALLEGVPGAANADSLGRAYAMLGELESAIAVFERELQAAQERDDVMEVVRFSVLLANALIDSSNFGRAAELLGGVLARVADSSDPIMRARLWWSQSRLHDAKGESDLAAQYARRALDVLDATEHTQYAALAHQLLAHIEIDRGHASDALRLLEEGYPLLNARENKFERASFKLEEARALAQLGERERAIASALEVSSLLRETSPSDAGRAYLLSAEVFEQLGERERARELYELAIEEMPENGRYRADAYTRLAGLLEAEGRTEEALALLKRAVRGPEPARRPD